MPSAVCPECNGKISTKPYARKEKLAEMIAVHMSTCPGKNRGKNV